MDFLKVYGLDKRCGHSDGSIIIKDGKLILRIYTHEYEISTVGLIDGGIGCVMKRRDAPIKANVVIKELPFDDIPANLKSIGYKFKIPARKVSEIPSLEYVFMFEDAKMVKTKDIAPFVKEALT